jgi:ubiquitin
MAFEVFVRSSTGKTTVLEVEVDMTIADMKRKIHEKEGIAPEAQRLIVCGRQLIDERCVGDYARMEGYTIHIFPRLPSEGSPRGVDR